MKRFCRIILNKAMSWRGEVFRGAPVDMRVTKAPLAECLLRMRLMVERVRPTRPAISLCHMPSRASASTWCRILYSLSWIRAGWQYYKKQNAWTDISWKFRDMSDITQQTIGRATYCFTVLKLGSVAFLLAILRTTDESTSMKFSR